MSIREKMNGPAGTAVVVVILALSVVCWFALAEKPDPGRTTNGWYFLDLNTKELVKKPVDTLSPADGGQSLRAYVFSCSSCDDKASHFIAYLERYTDDALAAVKDTSLDMDVQNNRRIAGWELRSSDSETWIKATSPEGQKLMNFPLEKCSSSKPQPCDPEAE